MTCVYERFAEHDPDDLLHLLYTIHTRLSSVSPTRTHFVHLPGRHIQRHTIVIS